MVRFFINSIIYRLYNQHITNIFGQILKAIKFDLRGIIFINLACLITNFYDMNKLIKILCTVTLIATSFSIKADNETPKLDGPVSSTLLKKETVSSQRPRTLGDMFITCYYNNKCICN